VLFAPLLGRVLVPVHRPVLPVVRADEFLASTGMM